MGAAPHGERRGPRLAGMTILPARRAGAHRLDAGNDSWELSLGTRSFSGLSWLVPRTDLCACGSGMTADGSTALGAGEALPDRLRAQRVDEEAVGAKDLLGDARGQRCGPLGGSASPAG